MSVQSEIEQDKKLAILFHDTYEFLAPYHGYETRNDTKQFDDSTPNGQLMIAVAHEINKRIAKATQLASIEARIDELCNLVLKRNEYETQLDVANRCAQLKAAKAKLIEEKTS